MSDINLDARIITDDNTKIKNVVVSVRPPLNNPYFVENDSGEEIGSATLRFTSQGVEAELFLDHKTPERLDFETEPNRLNVVLDMEIDPAFGLIGKVLVERT